MYHATNQTVEDRERGATGSGKAVKRFEKKGLLYSHFHHSSDCQAWSVNKAYEPIYSIDFLHFVPALRLLFFFFVVAYFPHGNKSAKTMENTAQKRMILGTIARIMASERKLNDWLTPSVRVYGLILLVYQAMNCTESALC